MHIFADAHKTVKTAEKIANTSSIDWATTRVRVNSKLLVSYLYIIRFIVNLLIGSRKRNAKKRKCKNAF